MKINVEQMNAKYEVIAQNVATLQIELNQEVVDYKIAERLKEQIDTALDEYNFDYRKKAYIDALSGENPLRQLVADGFLTQYSLKIAKDKESSRLLAVIDSKETLINLSEIIELSDELSLSFDKSLFEVRFNHFYACLCRHVKEVLAKDNKTLLDVTHKIETPADATLSNNKMYEMLTSLFEPLQILSDNEHVAKIDWKMLLLNCTKTKISNKSHKIVLPKKSTIINKLTEIGNRVINGKKYELAVK